MVDVLANFALSSKKKTTHMLNDLYFSRYEVSDWRKQIPKETLVPDFCPQGVFPRIMWRVHLK